MFLVKTLNDEIKKLREEKKSLSKNLNNIKRDYFLQVKKNLFYDKTNYNDLYKINKILFINESDYEKQKFIFEELDFFYKYRKFILFSGCLFLWKRIYFGKANVIPNFNLKFFLSSFEKSKKIFLAKSAFIIFFSAALFKYEKKYFEFEISNNININSRLGIFLWFETNYRNGYLNVSNFNFLDNTVGKKYNLINKNIQSELNQEILENINFYVLIKQHYFNIYTTKIFNNIITPLINNEKNNHYDQTKFMYEIQKNYLEKIQNEKYYIFNEEINQEMNNKAFNLFDDMKKLFENTFNHEYNGFENKKSDKLFLTEDSLLEMIRLDELNQIFLNENTSDNIKEFYRNFKIDNI